jgi:hypothetical protein
MTILFRPRRNDLTRSHRIVIPTGAPKERSGGTCGFAYPGLKLLGQLGLILQLKRLLLCQLD